jgi:hypothetical protein
MLPAHSPPARTPHASRSQVREFMPGISVIAMDNYNDSSKVIDSNFDGEGLKVLPRVAAASWAAWGGQGGCCRGLISGCAHWYASRWACALWPDWVWSVAVCCADPRLTDYDTLLKNLADLRAGKAVQVCARGTASKTHTPLSSPKVGGAHSLGVTVCAHN